MKLRAFGVESYDAVTQLQHDLVAAIQRGDEDETILYGEHPPTLSRGRRSPAPTVSELAWAARHGLAIATSARGGATTIHAPGQAIVYPLVRLGRGVVAHVAWLTDAARAIAAEHGISAHFDRAHPGLWVGTRKLASVGVRIERRVTSHGLAINVVNDLDLFSGVEICATPDLVHTSFAYEEVRPLPTAADVARRIALELVDTRRPKDVA